MSGYGRPPPDADNMVSLKVDNLTYRTKAEDLHKVFSKYGEVGDVYIPKDRRTKESRGFAFVRFYERRDAEDAMDEMDGATFDGRDLRVQKAKYGRPSESRRPPFRGYRGEGSGYNDRNHGRYSRDTRRRRSRSRSRSPRRRRYSKSPSKSRSRSPRRRSPSRSKSRSPLPRRSPPAQRSLSRSKSRSPVRNRSPARSPSPAKSRSRSPPE